LVLDDCLSRVVFFLILVFVLVGNDEAKNFGILLAAKKLFVVSHCVKPLGHLFGRVQFVGVARGV
jgi:hypothetical protein